MAVISPPSSLVEVDDRSSQSTDELNLDLASITSSVLDYEFENGRRYHAYKAGSYPLPNDEAELERIDIKHHVFILLCSGHLHLVPLLKPDKILDLGTGTGIWAMEMADQYPESTIIGTDLSPVQPTWVPDNVRFEIDDFESKSWFWRENYFDYIHSRFLVSSVSSYPALIRKAFKHCRPGGYYELQDLNPRFYSDDGTLQQDSSLSYWSKVICEASAKYHRPVPHHNEFNAWFEEAGFEDVKQFIFKSPTNPWPKSKTLKESGKFQLLAHLEGLEGISLGLLTRALEWKPEEVKILMAKIRPELRNKAIHSYQIHFAIFGRKPKAVPSPLAASSRLSPSAPTVAPSMATDGDQNLVSSPTAAEPTSSFTPVIDFTHLSREYVRQS